MGYSFRMEDTAPASELERRKSLRIRLRRDLAIEAQKYEGRTYYVIKDPVSLRYYRLKDNEFFLLQFMDGKRTLEDAQKAYEAQYRPDRLKLEDVEGFAQQLMTGGLAQNESPRAGKQLFDRRKKKRREEWMQTLTNILYIKIPIIDPDRLLKRMIALARLDLLGVVLPAQHRPHAQRRRPRRRQLRQVPRQTARLPRVLQLQDRRLPVGRPGRGQGDPRVRPRPQLQEVRRRSPRDGLFAALPVAGPLLQRFRRLDAAQQVAPHHHQLGRHLRRTGHRRHRHLDLVVHADPAVLATTCPWP